MFHMSSVAGKSIEFVKSAVQKIVSRATQLQENIMVKVGEKIPSVELYEETHLKKINIALLCSKKKVIIFGVPGAFTPDCSKTHLPGYVHKADEFKKKGIAEIICISVNDPFVMDAWAKEIKTEGKVRMLADPMGEFVKKVDLTTKLPFMGPVRSKRFSMVVDNGIVRELNVEPDGIGLTCSLADKLKI